MLTLLNSYIGPRATLRSLWPLVGPQEWPWSLIYRKRKGIQIVSLKIFQKENFFARWLKHPALKNERLGSLCTFKMCIGAKILSHSLWILKKFFSTPIIEHFLPFKKIWLHFELCENKGIKRNQMTCRCHVIDSHQSVNHWLEYAFQLHCYKCDFFSFKRQLTL